MAQVARNVQNNFIAGLKTEYTGLNFPENAATSCSNMDFSLIGDASRRGGIDYEANSGETGFNPSQAFNTYKWNNVGGDGQTQIVVVQNGNLITFFKSSAATITTPLSKQALTSVVDLSVFTATGGSFDVTLECQFADGNGYLFIFHPSCDPVYCTFANNLVTPNLITIQIRDFAGVPEPGVPFNNRPLNLTNEHLYNLQNQGWSTGVGWVTTSPTQNTLATGNLTFQVAGGLPIKPQQQVVLTLSNGIIGGYGTVVSYSGTTLVVNVLSVTSTFAGQQFVNWTLQSAGGYIQQYKSQLGVFPSNAEQWWVYKNASGLFDPNTVANITLNNSPAPSGSYILNAFNQDRTSVSGVQGITPISTKTRPRTGCWFQGRVWYSGVDASQQVTGDAPYTTWTENIYFSQIVQNTSDFGTCYQTNDPTSETLFDLLPTDGGVIVIQGSGSVYKLFPVQNGLLVFAANGIWFITGSTGLGFTANDYTATKISGVQSISGTSFVNVLGWPYFWNLEGIYRVIPGNAPEGQRVVVSGIDADNLTLGNILTFYQNIPVSSKLYARGTYDPINYQLQWCYRSVVESGVSNRYAFDSILVHNIVELPREARTLPGKVFYPYSIAAGTSGINQAIFPVISGIVFVQNPQVGANVPPPLIKYLVTSAQGFTFAEENNFTTFTDWLSFDTVGIDPPAFIVTGYNLKPQHHPYYGYFSQALVKHSASYINVFIRNTANNSYLFNSIWDWAIDASTGKFSSQQQVTNSLTSAKFKFITRRHRIRGRGYSLQLQFQSQPGKPMDLIGWSVFESVQEAP